MDLGGQDTEAQLEKESARQRRWAEGPGAQDCMWRGSAACVLSSVASRRPWTHPTSASVSSTQNWASSGAVGHTPLQPLFPVLRDGLPVGLAGHPEHSNTLQPQSAFGQGTWCTARVARVGLVTMAS